MSLVPRSYPRDLADRVRATWPATGAPLPRALDAILDTAYHASFLRDEARPVHCRLMFVAQTHLPTDDGPPSGLWPLAFETPRPFSELELRSLSPAAKYQRALIAVEEHGGVPHIWGVIQTGTRWLQSAHGGHALAPPMPEVLVINVVRPGHLAVACGSRLIAELRGGTLTDFTLDVFLSRWLRAHFAEQRAEVADAHHATGGTPVRDADATELIQLVAQQMVKRTIATMRAAHHGGTIIIVPPACDADRYLHPKYAFCDDEPRRRFRRLVLTILGKAAETAGPSGTLEPSAEADEALFELSNLIAALADVDGAVMLTKRFEILGFGAEIAGDLPNVTEVRRALDLECDEFVTEVVDAVGTRHRSAYRLCAAVPEAVAIVVSQDGAVRFATTHRGAVTYWEHGPGDQ